MKAKKKTCALYRYELRGRVSEKENECWDRSLMFIDFG